MVRAGILSDTHLAEPTEQFKDMASRAFVDCDVIFHAGDITSMMILKQFGDTPVHAVHGNMCGHSVMNALPKSRIVTIADQTIALCHGADFCHSIEERMWALFPQADCIIYGHTHQPVCESKGGVLFINPGSFQCTSRHGSPATYVLMEIRRKGLKAQLHSITIR